MAVKRNRKRQTTSLQERLLAAADIARERARRMPAGTARDMLLRSAKQNEMASSLTDWLYPSGIQRRGGR
ncbi:hypothetical protein QA649_22255 [Bradyrhizobium sp. CB1717]|uniref:hypothetical protein n=1 Tax=Bradyrhizobium sp. CB1717 TaxID=3039154 RepID=UPI0024B07D34|nr:hypothetical protein [Bradyrhizobium sp. CB1717]WFU20850.1 hypothetical protein QA649_22255 [Bradyrhizobium sp. CB1717]